MRNTKRLDAFFDARLSDQTVPVIGFSVAIKESGKIIYQCNGGYQYFSEEKVSPPMEPDERTLAYVEHIRALSEAHGIPFKHKGRGGLSDANHITACGPICVDGLDPTGDFDHSDKEYLEISTIEPNVKFAWLLLCDLAEQK